MDKKYEAHKVDCDINDINASLLDKLSVVAAQINVNFEIEADQVRCIYVPRMITGNKEDGLAPSVGSVGYTFNIDRKTIDRVSPNEVFMIIKREMREVIDNAQ